MAGLLLPWCASTYGQDAAEVTDTASTEVTAQDETAASDGATTPPRRMSEEQMQLLERFLSLSDEQLAEVRSTIERIEDMSPEQREALRSRLRQFYHMDRAAREQMRAGLERLPPPIRRVLRDRWMSMSEEERRADFEQMRSMTPAERQTYYRDLVRSHWETRGEGPPPPLPRRQAGDEASTGDATPPNFRPRGPGPGMRPPHPPQGGPPTTENSAVNSPVLAALQLEATERVRVMLVAEDPEGYQERGTLQAGDTRLLLVREPSVLFITNGAALQVTRDGESIELEAGPVSLNIGE